MTTVECFFLDTGYCLASEHHMLLGGRHQTIECHSLVALIRHPQHGWGLWDTGYAPRMLEAARGWPFGLYRRATPLRIQPELAVVNQLARRGLQASDIRWIILSHLHADHLAGLHDFPAATLILAKAAFEAARNLSGLRALSRALIPSLLPANLAQRSELIHQFVAPPVPALGATHDLFNDGSMRLIDLGGHARGQLGMLVRTPEREILLAADAVWLSRAIAAQRMAHPLTWLVADSVATMRISLLRLYMFARLRPEVAIVPTHCPDAFAREIGSAGPVVDYKFAATRSYESAQNSRYGAA